MWNGGKRLKSHLHKSRMSAKQKERCHQSIRMGWKDSFCYRNGILLYEIDRKQVRNICNEDENQ